MQLKLPHTSIHHYLWDECFLCHDFTITYLTHSLYNVVKTHRWLNKLSIIFLFLFQYLDFIHHQLCASNLKYSSEHDGAYNPVLAKPWNYSLFNVTTEIVLWLSLAAKQKVLSYIEIRQGPLWRNLGLAEWKQKECCKQKNSIGASSEARRYLLNRKSASVTGTENLVGWCQAEANLCRSMDLGLYSKSYWEVIRICKRKVRPII